MATVATLSVLLEAKGQRRFLGDLTKATAAVAAAAVAFDRLITRGGDYVNLEGAFVRATKHQEGALRDLSMATHGLISDMELMRQANTALAMGSVETVGQFQDLAQTAQILGRALGLDATSALESLNIGIARQSRLILDNLGLVVSASSANQRYADAIGVSVDALTDAQRAEAFRAEALRQAAALTDQLGGVTLNAADAWRAFRIEITDGATSIGAFLAQSGPLKFLFTDLRALVQLLKGDVGGAIATFKQFDVALSEQQQRFALGQTDAVGYSGAIGQIADAMRAGMADVAAFRQEFDQARASVMEFEQHMALLETRLVAIGPIAEPAINPLTGKLLELGDASRLLTYQYLPDFSDELAHAADFAWLFEAGLAGVNQQVDELNQGISTASRILSGLGGIGRFLQVSIPFLSQAGGLISAASAFSGFFADGGTIPSGSWGVVGERGPEIVQGPATVSTGMTVTINVPAARDPITFARDQQWQRAIAETFRNLQAGGFRTR